MISTISLYKLKNEWIKLSKIFYKMYGFNSNIPMMDPSGEKCEFAKVETPGQLGIIPRYKQETSLPMLGSGPTILGRGPITTPYGSQIVYDESDSYMQQSIVYGEMNDSVRTVKEMSYESVVYGEMSSCMRQRSIIEEKLIEARELEISFNRSQVILSYLDVLSLDPNNIEALIGKARIFEDIGNECQATKDYESVLSLDPTNVIAKSALERLS